MKERLHVTLISNQKEYQNKLLNLKQDNDILEIKEYGLSHDVPIIQDEGLVFLTMLLKIKKPVRILEIGSAIGYSAINMARNCNAIIDTFEIKEESYNIAKENIKKCGLEDRINIYLGDALETFDIVKDNKYDFIFIDAAKAQYIKFFELYAPLLNKDGIIFTDNLYFHNLLFEEVSNRDLRGLVRKVGRYNDFLINNNDFETHIFRIGDGIGVSIKK